MRKHSIYFFAHFGGLSTHRAEGERQQGWKRGRENKIEEIAWDRRDDWIHAAIVKAGKQDPAITCFPSH